MSFLGNIFKKKDDPLKDLENFDAGNSDSSQQDPFATGLPAQDQQDSIQPMPEQGSPQGVDSFGNQLKPQSFDQYQQNNQPMNQSSFQNDTSSKDISKDLQLILAKIDTLRAEMTNVNQRLENIERQQEQGRKYKW